MVEPHNSFRQRLLCRILDHYEYFDDRITEWRNRAPGRMTDANLALSWVIFVRDRARFEHQFPRLRILDIRYPTVFLNVVSGGMSYRAFVPASSLPVLIALERALRPSCPDSRTMMTIDVAKV